MNRFLCHTCHTRFSVDHREKKKSLWIRHLDGAAFRSLGNEEGLTGVAVFKRVQREMDALPENTSLTLQYCNRFCGILNVDGKYITVKGYKKKIPFIYAMDFLSHDILMGLLAPAESSEAFLRLFQLLKTVQYPLQVVVCDDVLALKDAARHYYPKVRFQLCQNHYLENIRQAIHFRTEEKYRHFFHSMVKHVFEKPKNEKEREAGFHHVFITHSQGDPFLEALIMDVYHRRQELFCYQSIPRCPATNNLIESFNSYLNGRLETIKGFQSFHSAKRWLNAWMIRRRTKPFTDCEAPFAHLNGKTSISQTTKKDAEAPSF